jgi:hypothetical protein
VRRQHSFSKVDLKVEMASMIRNCIQYINDVWILGWVTVRSRWIFIKFSKVARTRPDCLPPGQENQYPIYMRNKKCSSTIYVCLLLYVFIYIAFQIGLPKQIRLFCSSNSQSITARSFASIHRLSAPSGYRDTIAILC